MTRFSKIVLIIAGILVVFLAIKNLAVKFIDSEVWDNFKSVAHVQQHYNNADAYSIASNGSTESVISVVDVDWIDGQIDIQYGEAEKLTWSETFVKGEPDNCTRLHYNVGGDTLYIRFGKSGEWDKQKMKNVAKDLVITLPQNTQYKEIMVDHVNGDVCINADADIIDVDIVNGTSNVTTRTCKKVKMSIVNGGEILNLPQDASFKAKIDKVNGTINVDFGCWKVNNTYCCGQEPFDMNIDLGIINGSVFVHMIR